MKIQVQRGDRVVTLTPEQARTFAFQAGDRVTVADHGAVQSLEVPAGSDKLQVSFQDGTMVVLPAVVGLMQSHDLSVSLEDQAVLVDSNGLARGFAVLSDNDEPQEAPPQLEDLQVLPDVIAPTKDGLMPPALDNAARMPDVAPESAAGPNPGSPTGGNHYLAQAPGVSHHLLEARALGDGASLQDDPRGTADDERPGSFHNTSPGAGADFADGGDQGGAPATTPAATQPGDKGAVVPVLPAGNGGDTPANANPGNNQPTDTTPTDPNAGNDTPTIPTDPNAGGGNGSGGGSGGGGSSGGGPPAPSAPAKPVITGLDAASDSGTAGDGLTSQTTPTITGTAVAGLVVTISEGGTVLGTATADSTGAWSFTPTTALGEGAHTLTATATQNGLTSAPSDPASITIDTTAPTTVITGLDAASDTGTAGDGVTSQTTPTLTGTAEAGAVVTIAEGTAVLGTATADANGTWTFTPGTAFSEGGHVLSASAVDPAGNQGQPSADFTLTIDTQPPAVPAITGLAAGQDTGANAADGLTKLTTPAIGGTADPGTTVTLMEGTTVLGSAVADPSGNWTITPTSALSDGAHTLTATATDAAGNASAASTSLAITIDASAPAVPVFGGLDATTDTGSSSTDGITSNTTPILTGTAEAGSTVTVMDGSTTLGTATADGSGNWTFTSTALAEGDHAITVTATDAAGNASAASVAKTITVDATAPTSAITGLTAASDTGSSDHDSLTRSTTPTLTGTTDPNAVVTVFEGSTTLGTATADASGKWTFTATLNDGAHALTASAVDPAGNQGAASAPFTVTVDTGAPAVPTLVLDPASDTGSANNDHLTQAATPTLTGTAEAGSTVTVMDGSTTLGTATADPSGTWTFTTTTLADGAHTLTATATDAAGNVSAASAGLTVTVDTGVPAVPVIGGLTSASDTGASSTDGITSNTTPTLTGTAEAGSTVTIMEGSTVLGTATADGAGSWTFTTATLGEGHHGFTATATDAAGNTSSASASKDITVDTTAPAVPAVTGITAASDTGSANNDGITGNRLPTFTGTGEADTTITLMDGSTVLGTTTVDPSGTWTFTPGTALADATLHVTARASDLAGNSSVDSAAQDVTIDGTAPAAPVVTGLTPATDTGNHSDGITSLDSPTIQGTAEAGSTVTVMDGTTILGSATADPSGHWTFPVTSPLSVGTHGITATATDAAGNTGSASASKDITILAAPPGPVITNLLPADDTGGSSTDGITKVAAPTLVGTGVAGNTIEVFDGATSLGTTTVDPLGDWQLVPDTPLTEGQHTLTAVATDLAGTLSAPSADFAVTVDLTAPGAPVLNGLTAATDSGSSPSDDLTNNTTPTLQGTAEAGSTVTIAEGTTVLGTATADAGGNWTFALTTPLAEGPHTFTAKATDLAGNTGSDSAGETITVDLTPPGAAAIAGLTAGSDTGTSHNDGLTANATPTITGTADPNTTVQIVEGTTVIGTAQADGGGNWSFTPTAALADGAHALTARAVDAAGNTGADSAPVSFSVDTQGPAAPTIAGLTSASDTGSSSTDGITTIATPSFTGSAEAAATVAVYDGGVLLGTTTADGGTGAWTFTPTSALADGAHAITATATDAAGNVSQVSAAGTVTIATGNPAAPVITGLTAASDTGVSNTDGLTSKPAPTLQGTAAPGSTVQVYDSGNPLGTATTDTQGHWSFTPTSGLTDGTHTFTADATDAAGNVSAASAAKAITIDAGAPPTPVFTGLTAATDTGAVNNDGITANARPTFTGTAEAGSAVQVFDGTTLLGTVQADGGGNWAFTPTTPLANGDHAVTIAATDAAGNVSTLSAPRTITIDPSTPTGLTITGLSTASDSGSSSHDDLTSNTAPTLVGTAPAGLNVEVFENGTLLGTATADGSGNWSFDLPGALADGQHTFTAIAETRTGTQTETAQRVITIDTTAPAAATIGGLTAATDTGASNADGMTKLATPTITGTAEPGATVEVFDGGTSLGTTTADGTGAWSFTPVGALGEGAHTLTAKASDAAGNPGPVSLAATVTVDTSTPAAPVVTGLTAATDTGVSSTDGVTAMVSPTLTGTAEAGSVVKVFDNGTLLGTATADPSGTWSFTPTTALASGSHGITATATDAAGNVSALSGARAITVDTAKPGTPTITGLTAGTDTGSSSSDAVTSNAMPTITGAAAPNAAVQIYDGTTLLGTAVANGGGAWSFTPTTALSEGPHGLTAVAVNVAGNASQPSAAKPVVIDTTAPNAPVVAGLTAVTDTGVSSTDGITSVTKPTLVGSAEPNTVVQILDGSSLLGTATVDATGAWSYTFTTDLTAGTHAIAVAAIDKAGNQSASTAHPLTIQVGAPGAPVITGLTADTDKGVSSTDGTTNDVRPSLTGTAGANELVSVFEGSTLLGTVQADGAGTWVLPLATALAEGPHTFTASSATPAGATGATSAPKTITIDTSAPTIPAVTGLATASDSGSSHTDAITNATMPTITGTAEAGATVTVLDGTTVLGTATADNAGKWSFTPTTALADGTHAITANSIDAAGNASAASLSNSIQIDATAPAAPIVAGLTTVTDTGASQTDGVTDVVKPTIAGTAEPNAIITISDGSTVLGTTTADAGGNWTFVPTSDLAEGQHTITATGTDVAGNVGTASTAKTITIQTIDPTAPVVTGISSDTDSGTSSSDGLTSVTTPTILGTAQAGTSVTVFDNGVMLGTTTVDGTGHWRYTPASLADGPHSITAAATDLVGHTGTTSAAKTITIDSTAPATPALTGLAAGSDTGASTTDGITSQAMPTLNGTGEAGSTVQVYDGTTALGTVTVGAGGTWSFTPTSPLADGTHTLTAVAGDAAGNASASSNHLVVTVDGQAPLVPILTGLTPATDTGRSPQDGETSQTLPVLTGTGEPGSTLQIFDNTLQVGTVVVDGTGAWTYTPAVALTQGTHAFSAKATDTAGNVSSMSSPDRVIKVDTAAPAAPTITGLATASDTGVANNDNLTSITTPTITGTAEANALVTIKEGASILGTVVADLGGNWSFTPTAALSSAIHNLTATATDMAGNVSPLSTAKAITVDTSAPAAPVITGLTAATDTGSSSTDGLTTVTTPTIQGTALAGSTVKVFDGATLLGTTTADPSTGAWQYTPSGALGLGLHTLTAVAVNNAGSSSAPSAAKTIGISGTPGVPTIAGLTTASDTGSSATDGFTSVAKPTLTGTAPANSTVKILDGGSQIGTATADASGNWTFTPATALTQVGHVITVTATDATGTTSAASAPFTVTYDATAPVAPIITGLTAATDTGSSATDGTTSVTQPTIQGTGEAGTVLTLKDGSTPLGTTTVDPSGNWSFTPAGNLAEGPHSITVFATDAAGNVGAVSAARPLLIDTGAPNIPVITGLLAASDTGRSSTDGVTSNAKPTLQGTAENNATVQIFDGTNTTPVATVTADGTGKWSYTPASNLTDGNHVFTARAVDAAGNTSGLSAGYVAAIDTAAPAAPLVAGLATGSITGPNPNAQYTQQGTPTILGSAEPYAVVTLKDNGSPIATVTADGNGSWSYTPTTALTTGTHTLSATATDVAGNVSVVSAGQVINVITTGPGTPVITGLNPLTDSNITTDGTTFFTLPQLKGTAQVNSTVTVYDGGTKLGTTNADGSGNWVFTPASALSEATHVITVTATDAAGNVSATSAPKSILVDKTAPPVPAAPTLAAGSDAGISATDNLTNVVKPTFQGSAEKGSVVTVYDGANLLGTANADATTGAWSYTPTTALTDGLHTVTVTATDLAGNDSAKSASLKVTIDSATPATPTVKGLTVATDTGVSDEDAVTLNTKPTITGTGTANDTVQLFDNGSSTPFATVTVDATGTWTYTPTTAMSAVIHSVTAKDVDIAGNVSAASAAKSINIDTLPPAAPVVTGLTSATDTGTSSSDNLTNRATPTIQGTAENNSTVEIDIDGQLDGFATASASGAWTYTPSSGLSSASHSITAKATDVAGNTGPVSAAKSITIDTQAPPAPVVTGLAAASDTGIAGDGMTSDTTPTIQGTADKGAIVKVYNNGVQMAGPTVIADATTGAWSFTPTTALTTGLHAIKANATDAAGNVSIDSGLYNVTIVNVIATPIVNGLAPSDDTGRVNTDLVTRLTQPAIVGSATANSTVTISDGATVLGTTTADATGTWTFTPPTALSSAGAGTHSITATAKDSYGNTSTASTAKVITIDTSAPAAAVITGLTAASDNGTSTTDDLTSVTTPSISGTAEANSTVTFFEGTREIGATIATGGAWTMALGTVAAGSHTITAKVTDLAGNVGTTNATYTFTVVNTAVPPVILGLAAGQDTGISASDGLTTVSKPTIVGTGTPGTKVHVFDSTTDLGTVTVPANGTWSFTPATAFTGTAAHTIIAKTEDGAGNLSAGSPSKSITIDPGATVTNVTSGTANGTYAPGSTISVQVTFSEPVHVTGAPTLLLATGSTQEKASYVSGSDTATLTFTYVVQAGDSSTDLNYVATNSLALNGGTITGTGGGTVNLTLPGTTAAGSLGTNKAIVITNTITNPLVAGLTAATDLGTYDNDNITNVLKPTVTGYAPAGSSVKVFDNNALQSTVTADGTGKWTFTPAANLTAGNHSYTAQVGTGTVSAAKVVSIVTAAPATPANVTLVATSDLGSSNTDGVTSVTTPTLTGLATAGTTVTILDNGVPIGTTTATSGSAFTFTPATALAAGAHSITVTSTDAAGNVSAASAAKALTIDTASPVTPTLTGLVAASDTGTSSTDGITTDNTPAVTGTVAASAAGATVQLLDGTAVVGSVVADASGSWTITSSALAAGIHSLSAHVVSKSGVIGASSASKTVVIENAAMTAPAIVGLTAATDTGSSQTDGTTNKTAPVLTGTATPGATVAILDGTTQLGTSTADSAGAWSYTFSGLTAGAHSITAKSTAVSGAVGTSGAKTITLDATAPAVTNVTSSTANGTYGLGDTISIQVTFGEPVVVDSSGGLPTILLGTGTTQQKAVYSSGSGTATLTFTYVVHSGDTATDLNYVATNSLALNGGTITDVAGNSAGAVSVTLPAPAGAGSLGTNKAIVLDTTAPNVPVITGLAAGSDTGSSTSDNLTNLNGPILNGTAEGGSTIQLFDNGTALISGTVNGAGAWSLHPTGLANGTHAFTVKVTDSAGNVSQPSDPLTITVDTLAPATPVITGLTTATDTGLSQTDMVTSVTMPKLQGTAEPGATVRVWEGVNNLGSTTADNLGNWSMTLPTLTQASHTITVGAVDAAGNAGTVGGGKVILVDANAPAAPVIAGLTTATDTGTSTTDGVTNVTKPTFTGTSEAGATIQVFEGTTLLGTTTASGTAWSFTPTTAFTPGAHSITAKAMDTAGNVSPLSAAKSVTIVPSLDPPVITALTAATDTGSSSIDSITNNTKPVITGTAVANATVTILDGAATLGTVTASGTGAWTYTPATALTQGTHNITAKAADSAGNASTASNTLSVVVDTAAPLAPVISGLTPDTDMGSSRTDGVTNNTKPTIAGTTEPGAAVQILDGAAVLATVTADPQGNWSYTFATALSTTAPHSITAKATDVAGNAGPASTAFVVTTDTTPPGAPTISGLSAATDTGTSSTDNLTNNATPAITGTTEAKATVQVFDGATLLGSTQADASGAWSFVPAAPLADGAHVLTAKATDLAGNTGTTSASKTITIDTGAPAIPTITGLTAASDTGSSSTDGITSNTKPTLTGSAENNAIVQVYDGTTLLGTTTASATGAWSYTPTTALAAGNHAITVVAKDAAGNASANATPFTVVIQSAIAAPVITGLSPATDSGASHTDGTTNQISPLIIGTAAANSTVTISEGATVLGTAVASGTGAWSFTPASPLVPGPHTLTAKATDAAGNVSTASTPKAIVIDISAPDAPTLAGLTADTDTGVSQTDGITANATPKLTGMAEPNATVQVFDGVTLLGTTTADGSGSWTFAPTTALSAATHTITAKALDLAGNLSAASNSVAVKVDTGAPPTPTVTGLSPASDTGSSSSDGITSVPKPVITGNAEIGATVKVFDGGSLLGTTTADAVGFWTFTPTTVLTQGTHAITAVALDAAGNASAASASKVVTIVLNVPTTPVVVGLTTATDTGASNLDGITSLTTPTLTGTADPGSSVKIMDGSATLGTVTANASGVWTLTPGTAMTDGDHNLTAVATDAAGNVSGTSAIKVVTIDTVTPGAPVFTGLTAATDTGVSSTDNETHVGTPTIVGTADAHAVVKIMDGATVLGTTTADDLGNWSFTPATALTDGTHALKASQTDPAGHASASSAAFNVKIDAAAPVTPVVTGLTSATDTGSSNADAITKSATPTIAGTAEANAIVTVYDGGVLLGTATANGTGSWSFTPTTAFTDGSHAITAQAADVAGNASPLSATRVVVIDTVAPVAPTVQGLTPASDTGVSNTDGITSNNAPTIMGTAEPGASVQVFDGATLLGTTSADSAGNWALAPGARTDGAHAITAIATDTAGNASPASTVRNIIVNTSGASAPTVLGLAASTDLGASSSDSLTSVARPTIVGKSVPNAIVQVFDGATVLGGATSDVNGDWSFTPVSDLAEGAHGITATYTDLVGHTSPSSVVKTITIDTSNPAAPTLAGITSASDSGASNADGITNVNTPTLTGTAEAGASVAIVDNGTVLGTATADGGGNWSFTPTSALADGHHALGAAATDQAGNVSPMAVGPSIVVDTAGPAAPTIAGLTQASDTGANHTDGVTSNDQPTLTGKAEPGAVITVLDGATTLGTATTDTAGNWSFTPTTALSNGSHTITAKGTDAAGNTGAASTAYTVTIATGAPGAPVISGLTSATDTGVSDHDGVTRMTRPAIAGTADANAVITVMDGATTLGNVSADASGNWTFTPASPLASGSHSFSATAIDGAGNTSGTSNTLAVTVDVTPPATPTLAGITAATDTGSSSSDGITSNAKPTFTGTADPGAGIVVFDGATQLGTAVADGSGTWSYTPTSNLAQGSHAVSAVAVDAAGNTSAATAPVTVTILAATLAAPTITGLTAATDTGVSSTDGITSNTQPTLTGTAPAGSTVTFSEGAATLGTATADATGAWTFTPTSPLGSGAHPITAVATDDAGNASAASAALDVTIVGSGPNTPVINGLTTATDSGSSNADGLTNVVRPTFQGTADVNTTLQVFDGGTQLGTVATDGTGYWAFTPATALTAGTHTITVKALDAAGNPSSTSASFDVKVDLAPPSAPVVTGLTAASDTGASSTDGVTSLANPTFTGTAEADATVTVYDGATPLGTATADASGTWTYTPTTALSMASHSITAKATDAAGNVSAGSAPTTITIDGSTPAAPVIAGLTTASDTGASNTDGITSNTQPTVVGLALAGATVTLSDGGTQLGTATADATGVWSFTPSAPLSAGSHALTATETTAAGGTSAASATTTIQIVTAGPGAPVITGLTAATDTGVSHADGITGASLPVLMGTAGAGDLVQVSDGGTVLGTAIADGMGSWSFTPPTALAEGGHSLSAAVVDAAGNVGTASAPLAVTVDQTAPTTATLTGPAMTNNPTPALAGTAEANALVTVYDRETAIGTTHADGTGAWSFTPGTGLADGNHSLSAQATDAAGNVGASSVVKAVVVDTAAPAVPTVTGLTPDTDTGTNHHDNITASVRPTIQGTAEAGSTVTVLDGSTTLGTTTADANGRWTYTPGSDLGSGNHDLAAKATDAAGNTSGASATTSVTVTPPGTPAPYHVIGSPGGLWFGDFTEKAASGQGGGLTINVHDVLAMPAAPGAQPQLPGAELHVAAAVSGHTSASLVVPEAAPLLITTDLLKHLV